MKLLLDIDGIKVSLRIARYQPCSTADWDDKWCKVDFAFQSGDWLNYHKENDELFLSYEVQELADGFSDLLNNRLKERIAYSCTEPDFLFILHPAKDVPCQSGPNGSPGGTVHIDILMDWRISFWDKSGLTSNYLSITLDRKDIERLSHYFNLVIGRETKSDPQIRQLIEAGVLIEP